MKLEINRKGTKARRKSQGIFCRPPSLKLWRTGETRELLDRIYRMTKIGFGIFCHSVPNPRPETLLSPSSPKPDA